jgi:Zn-dependent protease/predicted transcriptional regulator
MFKRYEVGTIYGIPLRLDITFLLVLPVFAWLLGAQIEDIIPVFNETFGVNIDAALLAGGVRPWVAGLFAALVLFTCVTLHELGHSAMAMHYGYEVESITLWLLGGIARPVEIPRNWVQEFWIAVAGPAVNLVIVACCLLVYALAPPVDILLFFVLYLTLLNIGLATFNMVPAFPLDGGRVLRAVLARNRSYLDATRIAARVGKAVAVLLGIVGLLSFDLVMVGIAIFVYFGATSEARQMVFDAALDGLAVGDVMTPIEDLVSVDATLSLNEFLEMVFFERHMAYPVFDSGQFVGLVTLADAQSAQRSNGTVADVMTPTDQLETVTPGVDATRVSRTLGKSGSGRLPVIDDSGSLRGVISRTDLAEAFRTATDKRRVEESVRSTRVSGRSQQGDAIRVPSREVDDVSENVDDEGGRER